MKIFWLKSLHIWVDQTLQKKKNIWVISDILLIQGSSDKHLALDGGQINLFSTVHGLYVPSFI